MRILVIILTPPENANITGLKSPGPGSLHVTAKLNVIQFSEILMIYGQTQSNLREINELLPGHIYCAFIGVKLKRVVIEPVFGLDPSAKCSIDVVFNY